MIPLDAKMRFSRIAIVINALQFISMTGDINAFWPEFIDKLLKAVSIFNVNIELLSPECVIRLSFR